MSSSRGLQALFFQSSHPTDEELLAWLDGELQGRAMARIRGHLDTCWRCRGRRDRFDRTITAFVETRLREHAPPSGMPPSATLQLSVRLDAVDARAVRPSRWRRGLWRVRLMAASMGRLSPARVAQASVAALTLLVIVLSIGRERAVSAQELLDRTVAAQEARLRPVTQPVVYQRLQVSRRGARAGETQETWEIWSDTAHGRYRERVGVFAPIARRAALDARACPAAANANGATPGPNRGTNPGPAPGAGAGASADAAAGMRAAAATPIRELESILCANGLAVAQPLSAAAFRQWRGRVRAASDDVRAQVAEGGRETMVLRTSLAEGEPRALRIREAELVVRADDWHPLAQRFTVQGEHELVSYELTELSFEIVPLASVAPTFFEEETRETMSAAPEPPAPPTETLVSDADLVAAEVQAWDALHRAGALLGEPVEVVRTAARRIEVRGLASSDRRKQAIVDAVGAIPLVTVDLRTVDEALAARAGRGEARQPAGGESAIGGATMVQTGAVPGQVLLDLYERAAGDGRLPGGAGAGADATASGMVSASREAMSQAWALERLARFAQGLDPDSVQPSARRTLDRMARDLAAATADSLGALDARVRPIVAPVLAPTASPAAGDVTPVEGDGVREADWPRRALRVFARTREADAATRRLFTESEAVTTDLATAARVLIEACADARQLATDLARQLEPPPAPVEPGVIAAPPRPPD